jgi:hypothetical protein
MVEVLGTYPVVRSEDETLDLALDGMSLARYGDGEMSIMLGGNCVSQIYDADLAEEMRQVALDEQPNLLPCIPNIAKTQRAGWQKYSEGKYATLWNCQYRYGSSLITRPDSAPWIDRPDYWAKIEAIWKDQDIVLVKGTDRSLRESTLASAKSVRIVEGPRRDAYAVLDQIEEEIGTPSERVLICLGPSATALAARLARKGVHALDLGHIGMFMRHAGLYAIHGDELISHEYRSELQELRKRQKWGADGHKHAAEVLAYAQELEAATVLDYGCGEQTLAAALKPHMRILGYDPGIPERAAAPKPCDLTVCLDVLEHIEPDRLDKVLHHIWCVTAKAAFFVIATRKANTILPSGRNAHLIIEPAEFWMDKLTAAGFDVQRMDVNVGREVKLWAAKKL